MKFKFNVKDKSVHAFLEKNLIGYKPNDTSRSYPDTSAYHLMQNEMYFKKECGIVAGEAVKIELFDRAQFSGKELVNTYIYRACEYDDIAIKLVLEEFTVRNITLATS